MSYRGMGQITDMEDAMSYRGMGQITDMLLRGTIGLPTVPPKPSAPMMVAVAPMAPTRVGVVTAPASVVVAPMAPARTGVVVTPAQPRVVVAPARPAPASASSAIANAGVLKATVDSLFRKYRETPYVDALKRNNTRRDMLQMGRRLVAALMFISPATEAERLRLRALASSALASSQARQMCFKSGASGCGSFGLNEPNAGVKINDEFVAMTRPLDTFLRTRNTTPIAVPVPRAPSVVAGRVLAPPAPAATSAVVNAAKEGAIAAAAKLATDVETAQKTTNPETKAAADKVIVAQAGADAAAKAAQEAAAKAAAAAAEAADAIAKAQASGSSADIETAQVETQIADAAHAAAEQATVASTEIAATADAARSELEAAAAATNDTSAQQAATDASMTVAVSTAGLGPLGISWKMWGVGAAVLVGGYLLMNSRAMSANRRRRARRNRRRR